MTDTVKVTVNTKALEDLAKVLPHALEDAIRRLAERGEKLLRQEIPVATNNLKEGVSIEIRLDTGKYEADLIVSARSGRRGARSAKVHYPSGNTKDVRLRPQPAFDYAEAVAKGRKAIRPKRAKVLLIPVSSVPTGEAYITSGGQTFVMRRQAKAVPANPYDKRALEILDREAETIVTAQLKKSGVLS